MAAKKIFLASLAIALVFSAGCLGEFRQPNPGLCEKVYQQQNRDACYHTVALASGDGLLCGKILGLNERDQCYMDLAAGYRTSHFID